MATEGHPSYEVDLQATNDGVVVLQWAVSSILGPPPISESVL